MEFNAHMIKGKLPITAVLVIYHEENLLERCLKSFSDLVSEIIVVHDGKCSDKSVRIAKKYTDKVYERKRAGMCEAHRVFTYQKAKNDWILQIDADEYLSPELRANLARLIKLPVDIYDFAWPGFFNGKHYPGPIKRTLFRKNKICYFGLMHHDPMPIGENTIVKKSNYQIIHEPNYEYLSLSTFRRKYRKWAKIHAGQLTDGIEKLPIWNCNSHEWAFRNKIRVVHPILFGIMGSVFYHMLVSSFEFLKRKRFYYLVQGMSTSLYSALVFYYVSKYKYTKLLKHLL